VSLRIVANLVAHSGGQSESKAILQLCLQLALKAEQDMAFFGPSGRPSSQGCIPRNERGLFQIDLCASRRFRSGQGAPQIQRLTNPSSQRGYRLVS